MTLLMYVCKKKDCRDQNCKKMQKTKQISISKMERAAYDNKN